MKKNEKMVFSTIKELHKKYPNHTLPDLLNEIKKNSEFVLIEKQSKIFGKLYDYTKKHLSDEKLEELNGLIQKVMKKCTIRLLTLFSGVKNLSG